MTGKERAELYCDLLRQIQNRMATGAPIAFGTNPKQVAACQRMVRYIALFRWLYTRALMADAKTALLFRASCLGKPWPHGGLDDGDMPYLRLMASGQYEDCTAEVVSA